MDCRVALFTTSSIETLLSLMTKSFVLYYAHVFALLSPPPPPLHFITITLTSSLHLTEHTTTIQHHLTFCNPQDNLGDAEEKIEKLVTQKADYEQQVKELEERLLDFEDEAGELGEKTKKMADEIKDLKADVEDLENSLAKVRC